MDFEKV